MIFKMTKSHPAELGIVHAKLPSGQGLAPRIYKELSQTAK